MAQAKQKPEDVGYDQYGGTGEQRCGGCVHFLDQGACEVVEGVIDESGLCDSHQPNEYKTASVASITRGALGTKLASMGEGTFWSLHTLLFR